VKVTVSGVGGFVGAHLVRELTGHGHQVVGLGKGPLSPDVEALVDRYIDVDLAKEWPDTSADAVVHLAGLSAVGPSFADPQRYLHGNSAPMTQLAENLLVSGARPRVVVVSTGAVYAPGVQVDEDAPIRTSSPYVVSKLLLEAQCSYYRARGLDVVVMRPFNHIGPGQQPGFLLPDLLQGVAAGSLTVGNLDTRRDYTDVRDVARAYRLAVEAPFVRAPVLNVSSGRSVSGREVLDLVARELGVQPEVIVDPARLRPDDPADISGDSTLIDTELGWRPDIDLTTTVRDALAASDAS
jgi:GDP-4-dehydro-6-deoxy-D-mannose reductase